MSADDKTPTLTLLSNSFVEIGIVEFCTLTARVLLYQLRVF